MTQTQRIARHLKSGKSITALQALNRYGCFRLASRVNELRETMTIKTDMVKVNNKYIAKYHL